MYNCGSCSNHSLGYARRQSWTRRDPNKCYLVTCARSVIQGLVPVAEQTPYVEDCCGNSKQHCEYGNDGFGRNCHCRTWNKWTRWVKAEITVTRRKLLSSRPSIYDMKIIWTLVRTYDLLWTSAMICLRISTLQLNQGSGYEGASWCVACMTEYAQATPTTRLGRSPVERQKNKRPPCGLPYRNRSSSSSWCVRRPPSATLPVTWYH